MGIPEIEIQSKNMIKPSTPTPATFRHHKMGFKDEVVAAINIRLILFYSAVNDSPESIVKFTTHLQYSLAQCLSRFYPFAGRYYHHIRTIECNDHGAEFVIARVRNNMTLNNVLDPELNPEILDNLLPCQVCDAGDITDPLLAVQTTVFVCGGLALGVCVSHKVADAATLCTFLNDWATLSRGDITPDLTCPVFSSSDFLPPRGFMDYDPPLPRIKKRKFENKYRTKRILFSQNAISIIRAKIDGGRRYSRVQLVSAMIWKSLIEMDREKHGRRRASMLLQPVNIRGKTTPPIPLDSCGNLGGFITTECSIAQTSMGFECLADLIHNSIIEMVEELGKLSPKSEELHTLVFNSFVKSETRDEQVSVFPLTSWCRFPFYETDFGLGRPVWVASSAGPVSTVTLMDGRGGCGINAYVKLEKEDMARFERLFDINEFNIY